MQLPVEPARRAKRVGRPRTLAGLPDAHSGPAFSTLVGLACLAAGKNGDIRDIPVAGSRPPKGVLGRFIAAIKGGS